MRCLERAFQICNRVFPVVENGGREGSVRLSFGEYGYEVPRLPCSARRDNRKGGGVRDRTRQVAIETGLHAGGIHRSQQNRTRAQCLAARSPCHCISPFIVPAS